MLLLFPSTTRPRADAKPLDRTYALSVASLLLTALGAAAHVHGWHLAGIVLFFLGMVLTLPQTSRPIIIAPAAFVSAGAFAVFLLEPALHGTVLP